MLNNRKVKELAREKNTSYAMLRHEIIEGNIYSGSFLDC